MPSDFCHTCFADLVPGQICARCGEDVSSPAEAGDVLAPGCVLGGKYKIGRLLGRGGFGATYLAWDTNLRVRIAIKEFLPRQLAARTSGGTQIYAYSGSKDAFNIGLEQFLNEARNLAQFLDHPGIISVRDYFPENGTGYMVMEYLAGSTLEQYLAEEGRLDPKVAIGLLVPVADALRACHAAGLIHRDISPDNIFLTKDHRVKLLDFGAARFAIGSRSTNLSVILKEGFAPFEQYQRNGRQGAWTDIYALTATLYRLVTGDLPPTAPDRLAGTKLPTVAEKGVTIPARLQGLLDKGMAVQAEQRYQTIDAFLADLRDPARPTVSRGPSDGPRWIRVAAIAGAVALIVGGAGLAMLWTHSAPPQVESRVAPDVDLAHGGETSPAAGTGIGAAANAEPRPEQKITAEERPPATAASKPEPTAEPARDARPQSPPRDTSNDVAVVIPPGKAPATAPPPYSPIEPMREYVRQAAQAQIQLSFALSHMRRASTFLSKIPQNPTSADVIQIKQAHEYQYNAAVGERDSALAKYLAQVDWLAGHDMAVVDAAIKLESDSASVTMVDRSDAEAKARVHGAIELLARHVRERQQNRLTPAAVIKDAE